MPEELNIGAFARRVGLTPSALRFYDDCGVLRPYRVDDATGYRYYAPDQEERGRLLRDLRRAGLPLPEARVVLDGPGAEARRVLDEHLRRTEETAKSAGAAVREILRTLPYAAVPAVRVGGPELASAIRQVAPAAAGPDADPPILGGLLVEAGDGELRVIGTDRYRLSVRVLRSDAPLGTCARTVVAAAALRDLAQWASRATDVTLELASAELVARDGVESRTLPALDGGYPDYAQVLDGLPAVRTRLIVDRQGLVDLLETHHDRPHVELTATDGELRVDADPLPAIHTGELPDACFAPRLLSAALSTGVGPDALIELTGPTTPAVIRSADQGTFTTLVMPVKRPDASAMS